jgi:hypothetical protein
MFSGVPNPPKTDTVETPVVEARTEKVNPTTTRRNTPKPFLELISPGLLFLELKVSDTG